MKKIYILGLMAALFASCKPNLEPEKPSQGSGADFTNYVSVGSSITAGYADGALYRAGQESSFPAILAEQFKHVGGGDFRQPLLPGEFGYPTAKMVLTSYQGMCDSQASLTPKPFTGALDTATSSTNIYLTYGPFNNMGIPGIRCVDYVTKGYGMVNPFAKRIFAGPSTSRPVDELMWAKPTFFTLWIGDNDVLGYAVAGGGNSADPTKQITNDYWFNAAYDTVLSTLRRNGAQGVLVNIPDVTSLPFFTTIPPHGLKLSQTDAYLLNNAYNPLGGFIRFEEGYNYFIIEDSTAPPKFRHIKEGEYILLSTPQDSIKCAGWGTKKPIPAKYVLTADEVAKIRKATDVFNGIIYLMAKRENLGLVDMYFYMKTLQSGIVYNGVGYNATFVSGGAFSLDGIHLTPRGYALVANKILMTINEKYGATIPMADVNKYKGIQFP
jgi:hypothetical protein